MVAQECESFRLSLDDNLVRGAKMMFPKESHRREVLDTQMDRCQIGSESLSGGFFCAGTVEGVFDNLSFCTATLLQSVCRYRL